MTIGDANVQEHVYHPLLTASNPTIVAAYALGWFERTRATAERDGAEVTFAIALPIGTEFAGEVAAVLCRWIALGIFGDAVSIRFEAEQ